MEDSQRERLTILMEECGEVIQAASKILRHGMDSHSPFDPNQTSNKLILERELGDLNFIISLMSSRGDIDISSINEFSIRKKESISQYLHHNTIK